MNPFLKMLLGGLIGGIIGAVTVNILINKLDNKPKIDLPEEYKLINPHKQLQGNYDPCTNTLHIWFNNPENNR